MEWSGPRKGKTRKQNNTSAEENKFKIDFNDESSDHKVSNKKKINIPNKKKVLIGKKEI